MKALKIATDKFVKSEVEIQNFDINISVEPANSKNGDDDDAMFRVTFLGKLSPGKRGLGTANRVPRSVTYFISKKTWTIIKEQGIR